MFAVWGSALVLLPAGSLLPVDPMLAAVYALVGVTVGSLLDVQVVPGVLVHVVRPGNHAGQQILLVPRQALEHPVHHRHGLCPGDVLVGLEGLILIAVDPAILGGQSDILRRPVVARVLKGVVAVGTLFVRAGCDLHQLRPGLLTEQPEEDRCNLCSGDIALGPHHTVGVADDILNWLAVLLENREFDVPSGLALEAKEYILKNFAIPYKRYDAIIGYRADDSYFSFAQDFINGTISYRQLGNAMHLGKLGQQFVLKSEKAFQAIHYVGCEVADASEWYEKKMLRDKCARREYFSVEQNRRQRGDIYITTILDEEMLPHDPRLR